MLVWPAKVQFVVNADFQYIHCTEPPAIPQSPESAADSGAVLLQTMQIHSLVPTLDKPVRGGHCFL